MLFSIIEINIQLDKVDAMPKDIQVNIRMTQAQKKRIDTERRLSALGLSQYDFLNMLLQIGLEVVEAKRQDKTVLVQYDNETKEVWIIGG